MEVEVDVSTGTRSNVFFPRIAALGTGGFVVFWSGFPPAWDDAGAALRSVGATA